MKFKILTGALLCLLLILGGCVQIKVLDDEAATAETEEAVEETTAEVNSTTEETINETGEVTNATKLDELETEEEASSSAITIKETELLQLNIKATDPDGNELTYTFSDPLNSTGAWQTERGDAGEYDITVTVTDSEGMSASQDLKIVVSTLNNEPVLRKIDSITIFESETITLNPSASDADDDTLEITYSGWMNSSTYTTDYDDEGNYTVTVKVTDGIDSVSQDVAITVKNKNRAPVIGSISLS